MRAALQLLFNFNAAVYLRCKRDAILTRGAARRGLRRRSIAPSALCSAFWGKVDAYRRTKGRAEFFLNKKLVNEAPEVRLSTVIRCDTVLLFSAPRQAGPGHTPLSSRSGRTRTAARWKVQGMTVVPPALWGPLRPESRKSRLGFRREAG